MSTRTAAALSPNSPADRQGFALAAAVLALVVIGAIVTGGFYAASQESRSSTSTDMGAQAFYAAERGLNTALGTLTRPQLEQLAIYAQRTMPEDTVVVGGLTTTHQIRVRRLGARTYFIESRGRVVGGGLYAGAERRVGAIVRTMALRILSNSALQVFGTLNVGGNTFIGGDNTDPSGWTECPADTSVAGVLAKDSSRVNVGGSATIEGSPAVDQDTTMSEEDFLDYGDLTFDELKEFATKQYAATETGNTSPQPTTNPDGSCETSNRNNWGAPLNQSHACAFYFPIIYHAGSLSVSGNGQGQGVLLIEGDLNISGTFNFYGIIIVKGRLLKPGGGTANLWGMSMIYGGGDVETSSRVNGTPIVQFSKCSIQRAQLYNDRLSRAIPLVERGWIDLTAAGLGT